MKWIAENAPAIWSGLAAIGVSSLMNIKDGKPKKYTVTSSLVCGIIAMSLSGMMTYFGLPGDASSLVGGVVGFLGADKLRDIANAIVNRRINGTDTQEGKNDNQQ